MNILLVPILHAKTMEHVPSMVPVLVVAVVVAILVRSVKLLGVRHPIRVKMKEFVRLRQLPFIVTVLVVSVARHVKSHPAQMALAITMEHVP